VELIDEELPENEQKEICKKEEDLKALVFQNYVEHMSPKKYSFHSRFGIVIEDLKTNKGYLPLVFKPVWTARRFLILTIGMINIYFENSLPAIFQVFIVIWANLLHLLYIAISKPFSDIQTLRLEFFNTLIFYTMSILFLYYIQSSNQGEDGAFIRPLSGFIIDTTFRSLFFIFTVVNLLVLLKD